MALKWVNVFMFFFFFSGLGNAGSAFVEIFVGQSMWPPEKDFVSFLPSTMLMSPTDSKTNKNKESIKMLNPGTVITRAK